MLDRNRPYAEIWDGGLKGYEQDGVAYRLDGTLMPGQKPPDTPKPPDPTTDKAAGLGIDLSAPFFQVRKRIREAGGPAVKDMAEARAWLDAVAA